MIESELTPEYTIPSIAFSARHSAYTSSACLCKGVIALKVATGEPPMTSPATREVSETGLRCLEASAPPFLVNSMAAAKSYRWRKDMSARNGLNKNWVHLIFKRHERLHAFNKTISGRDV